MNFMDLLIRITTSKKQSNSENKVCPKKELKSPWSNNQLIFRDSNSIKIKLASKLNFNSI